jgi:hypothetical protein
MNDAGRHYTPEEMADIYCSSKIVVNVSRDDWPQDANMRCFEAMAAGALLITRMPSELTDLGFEEDVHFAGWRDPDEVSKIVESWLRNDARREEAARRARALVLNAHTYDARAAFILETVSRGATAPARAWPAARVEALRLDYHVEYADLARSLAAFRRLAHESAARAAANLPKLVRLMAKRLKRRLGH